jgi:PAS domain S-box-containing protein
MTAAGPGSSDRSENRKLRTRLKDLEATLAAIRSGEVDALVVTKAGEAQLFTLKSADQTYRQIVEQMQKGALALSQNGLILYCNPFLSALLQARVETLLGVPLTAFLEEEARTAFHALFKAARQGVSRGDLVFKRPQSSVLTQVSVTALPIGDGEPLYCMIVTDLTDRTRREAERVELAREQVLRAAAEEAILTAQREIEDRKAIEHSLRESENEKTELLGREQQARREAVEANRMKDEFLATLSHELRSPLSAILGWAHVLRKPELDPLIATRGLDAIERNARAQADLVANLLDVSSIVTGQFQMAFSCVPLLEVIDGAADSVRPAALAKKIELEIVVEPRDTHVQGDASRVRQVFWNLLSNAIKFAPEGGRVRVLGLRVGAWVDVSVSDDGPGLEAAFLPGVFGRFLQADSSSTRRHPGLGLGLAIVRHLVELHGGTVEAKNNEEAPGAIFTVRLPWSPEASNASRSLDAPAAIPAAAA